MNFNKDSYWIKSGFFSLLQNISNLFFGFGSFYFLVRLLDKVQMGTWVLFVTVTSMLEVARIGFIKYGYIKFRAQANPDDQDRLFTAALLLNFGFAILVAISMFILGGILAKIWNAPELREMFHLYAFTSLVLVPFFQFEYLQHALLDFRSVFFSYFIRNGFLFFSILLSSFHIYQLSVGLLAILNLCGAVLGSIFCYFLVQKPLRFSVIIDWSWVWRLIHFGKFVVGTSLGAMLYSAADQFMLGSLLSTASVAIYNVAGRITNLINIPSMSLSAIIFPRSAKLIASGGKEAIKSLYELSVGAILAIVFPGVIFVLIFPNFVIQIIAGTGYVETVAILQITIFLSLFLPFSYQFGVTLDSIGQPNINFYFTALFFVINLTLNYFLISNYGIVGAAYGTLSTTIVGFIAMQVLMRFMLKVNIINVFKNMLNFYVKGFTSTKSLIVKKSAK